MKSSIKSRLAKLEAAAGEPPPRFDDMPEDELLAWLLDEAERFVACDDISDEHRAWLKQILEAHASGDPGALTRVAIPHDL